MVILGYVLVLPTQAALVARAHRVQRRCLAWLRAFTAYQAGVRRAQQVGYEPRLNHPACPLC